MRAEIGLPEHVRAWQIICSSHADSRVCRHLALQRGADRWVMRQGIFNSGIQREHFLLSRIILGSYAGRGKQHRNRKYNCSAAHDSPENTMTPNELHRERLIVSS